MDFVYKQYNKDPQTILYYKNPLFISGRGGHYGNNYDTPLWKMPIRYVWKYYRRFQWCRFKRNNNIINNSYIEELWRNIN